MQCFVCSELFEQVSTWLKFVDIYHDVSVAEHHFTAFSVTFSSHIPPYYEEISILIFILMPCWGEHCRYLAQRIFIFIYMFSLTVI